MPTALSAQFGIASLLFGAKPIAGKRSAAEMFLQFSQLLSLVHEAAKRLVLTVIIHPQILPKSAETGNLIPA